MFSTGFSWGCLCATQSYMSLRVDRDAPPEILLSSGQLKNCAPFRKFGRNGNAAASLGFLRQGGGVLAWPTASSIIRVTSSNAGDTAAGAGARSIVATFLDGALNPQVVNIPMNGTANVDTASPFFRLITARVGAVGTYRGSNLGTITITHLDSGEELGRIAVEGGLGRGQTELTNYTVPAGLEAHILRYVFASNRVQGNSNDDVVSYTVWQANAALTIAGDMEPARVVNSYQHAGSIEFELKAPEIYPAGTDFWITAEPTAANTQVSGEYDIALVRV